MTTSPSAASHAYYGAADAAAALVLPDLADELTRLREREAQIEALMEPLRKELGAVRGEAETIHDLAEEQAETDEQLVAFASAGRAGERLDAEARALHPYVYRTTRWAPDPHDDQFVGAGGVWIYPGLHVAMMRGGRGGDVLDVAQAEPLAQAMITFAARFCPDFVVTGQDPGMVGVSILGGGDYDDPWIWHTPDGSQAVFRVSRHMDQPRFSGTLVEVTARVIAWAAEDHSNPEDCY